MEKTNRGFSILEFEDDYGKKCSIQQSSSVKPRIWLGVHEAEPQIMVSDAKKLGIETELKNGWMPYPLPAGVEISTRMHLNKKQVKSLIKQLKLLKKQM